MIRLAPACCIASLSLLLIAGCAKPPGSITPVAVSSKDFQSLSCRDLASEINENRTKLDDAEKRQRNADAAGVFLILIPPTVFTGDAEDDVALAKGNDIAMRRAYEQSCGRSAA